MRLDKHTVLRGDHPQEVKDDVGPKGQMDDVLDDHKGGQHVGRVEIEGCIVGGGEAGVGDDGQHRTVPGG